MALFIVLFILFMFPLRNNADNVPDPGYYPSSKIDSIAFKKAFKNLWSSEHQKLEDDGTVTLFLDISSGSGLISRYSYSSGYFGSKMKLPDNTYTAGVDISLYLSNDQLHKGCHDEVDIELLGHIQGQPYVLQTNVYIKGSGDEPNVIGREEQVYLWFDPTTDFHTYAILWSPAEIIFLVDDVPIRQYKKFNDDVFPKRPMWVYGSIWDASGWATEKGKYRADYSFQPFIAQYQDFKVKGCHNPKPEACSSPSVSPSGDTGLSDQQYQAMTWVQNNYRIYNYCNDTYRDHTLTPECRN